MNLSETSEEFRLRLDVAKPDAQLQVYLCLKLPQTLPANPDRGLTREELIKNQELREAAGVPIKVRLDGIGLPEARVQVTLGSALVTGTPDQIRRAVALEEVIGAIHETATSRRQGEQDGKRRGR